MKIDKSKLEAMSELSDEELWKQIKNAANSRGINMPDKVPNSEELNKVRKALKDADKLNLSSAMKMINNLKKGKN